jgi:WD40 repeat protein/ABC-type dipeptide/oligopeptide/nickel transport system ATPase component
MSKSVVINLGSGNLADGFPRVTAQLWVVHSSLPEQYIGSLPPAPSLTELYRSWQMHYRTLCNRRQLSDSVRGQTFFNRHQENTHIEVEQDDELIILDEGITNISQVSFDELCQQFDEELNLWLRSESFLNIERQLRSQLNLSEEIRLIVETNDELLRRFPWHCWEFFRDYSKAEVAFSRPEHKRLEKLPETRGSNQKVRILAVLGNSSGIDLEAERDALKSFEDAEVEFLVNPSRQDFNIRLWDNTGWDILFFAGHSQTEEGTGRIYLNEEKSNNSLTIEQLEEALKTAIERGLKLAIFNSCDGMGLGLALEQLNIPVGIVMREPVPNRVAQDFFKFFLEAFAKNGLSLHLAVQRARRKLQGLEGEFPGASWLPAICMNPAVEPLTWIQMGGSQSCPYKGLSAFREEDAHLFCGRTKFIHKLAIEIKNKPLVAIIGASGSGKSSAVFAGLVPQLRTETPAWHPTIISIRLQKNPFALLAEALALAEKGLNLLEATYLGTTHELEANLQKYPDAFCQHIEQIIQRSSVTRVILIVDQFEELYTLCSKAEYQAFIDILLKAVNHSSNFSLVLTLRADFYRYTLSYRPLSDAIQGNAYNLAPMSREELRFAIETPATFMQATVEEALVDKLTEAVWSQPGHLSLLEFALTELWSRQQTGRLTQAAYTDIGGIPALLANHAEEVYSHLSQANSIRAKKVFTQMIQPSGAGMPKQRLATREEVQPKNWDLVKHLADKRLVVTNQNESSGLETVELAHESLIENWQRLAQWIEEDSIFRQWQERLRIALQQWQESDRDDEALWRGKLLSEAEYWQLHRFDELSARDKEFIEQSITLKSKKARWRRIRKQLTLSGLIGGVAITLGLASFALLEGQKSIVRDAEALSQSSDKFFASNQSFDALIDSLRAQGKIQEVLFPNPQVQNEIGSALRKALYSVNEYNRFEGHRQKVYSISFSHDGQALATGSDDKTVKLWGKDGTLIKTLAGHKGSVRSVSYSPDGQMLATGSDDKTVKLWGKDGTLIKTLAGHKGSIRSVSYSPDGQMLATSSDDKTIRIWNKDGTLLKTLNSHKGSVRSVSYSPNGQMLATSSDDKTIRIWNKEGKVLKTITGYVRPVSSVAFSPDSQIVVATSEDGTLRFWTTQGKLIKRILTESTLYQAIFSPDGQTVVSADGDDTVKVWSRNGTLLKTFEGHKDAVLSVALSPNGQSIASGSADRTIKLWSLDNELSLTLRGHGGDVLSAIFSPNDQTIATASADHTVKLWSRGGVLRTTIEGHKDTVHGISFSPDGKILATASWDKTIKLWSLEGKLLKTLRGHTDKVYDVSFSPEGKTIASASADGTVKLWSRGGKLLKTLKGHKDVVHGVRFSPNGQMIISASHDRTAKIWSKGGTLIKTLVGHDNWVHAASFSPDSRIVATASHDKTVKLWNLQGELLTTLRGHSDRVLGVAFSPDGKLLASSSHDHTVKLWSLDGREVTTLRRHGDWVHGLSFSHNSQTLASASYDNTAILWNLTNLNQPQALLQEGCAWVNDYLATNTQLKEKERHLCDETNSAKPPGASTKLSSLAASGRSMIKTLRNGISSFNSK